MANGGMKLGCLLLVIAPLWIARVLAAEPCAAPGGSHTALAAAADSLQPGTWCEFQTRNCCEDLLRTVPDSGSHVLEYNSEALWDPISRRLFIVGGSHQCPERDDPHCLSTGNSKTLYYDEATNSWTKGPFPVNLGHGYDHLALVPQQGKLYERLYNERAIYVYDIVTGRWADTPMEIPSHIYPSKQCAGALEFFPERNGLIWQDGDFGLYRYDLGTSQWSRIADTRYDNDPALPNAWMGSYHNISVYSSVKQVMVFGGGRGVTDLNLMYASGSVAAMSPAPSPYGILEGIVVDDPVGGDFLFWFDNEYYENDVRAFDPKMYQYDPALDEWIPLDVTSSSARRPPWFDIGTSGPIEDTACGSIGTYGVVLCANWAYANSAVYLYKHAQGVRDTTPPGVPANLRVQ